MQDNNKIKSKAHKIYHGSIKLELHLVSLRNYLT